MSMKPDDNWDELQRLFREALKRSRDERTAFLASVCQGSPELKRQVEALIEAHLASETIVAAADEAAGAPPLNGATDTTDVATDRAGDLVGPFRIIREVGRGGMGVVYEAEQDHPRRRVALKVMRSSLMSPAIRERFAHEAHLLGRLQHPGIAQIHQAGTAATSDGAQPWFAMEFIDGRTLTRYAREEQLSVRERFQLLAGVADAVEHAHQKGVIHRDLKPGNILVQESGREPQPKILDFGVARATDSDIQATRQTDVGQLLGTLPYMSPEQTEGDRDKLDTRSDIYALGVIGYELLAGQLPYDVDRKLVHEMIRIIQEEEPSRLSSIDRVYRGDIETIIGKALEKDPGRRYQNAGDMAADIRRHLNHEPIIARPASSMYHLRKFARRNRAMVAAAATVLVVTTTAAIALGILAFQKSTALDAATRANALASQRLTALQKSENNLRAALSSATEAEAEAVRQQRNAEVVRAFLEDDVIAQADPTVNQDRDLTVRAALDNAAARLGSQFADAPEVERSIQETLGVSYQRLGAHEQARTHLERARDLAAAVSGAGSDDERAARRRLGHLAIDERRFDVAIETLEAVYAGDVAALGEIHVATAFTARQLAFVYHQTGRLDEAEAILIPLVAAVDAGKLALPQQERWQLYGDRSVLFRSRGLYPESEAMRSRVLAEMTEGIGADHPDTLATAYGLAILLMEASRLAEGETLILDLIERSTRVLGGEDSRTLAMRTVLAGFLQRKGDLQGSLDEHTAVYEIQRRTLGPAHLETVTSLGQCGALRNRLGEYEESETILREVVALRKEMFGSANGMTIHAQGTLASTLKALGKMDEAESIYLELIESGTSLFGRDHARTLSPIHNLASVYEGQGRFAEAIPLYEEAMEGHRAIFGSTHPNTLIPTGNLAGVYLGLDPAQPQRALPLLEEAVSGFRESLGEEHWLLAATLQKLGKCLMLLGRTAEAGEALEKAVAIFEDTFGPDNERTIGARALLEELRQGPGGGS